MYVERIPNRNSPPAILLRESYREGNKIKKRTLANLSAWPAAKVEALRCVLREDAVAWARALDRENGCCSLGGVLGLGAVDEEELYGALDWLIEQQDRIERALARRHLINGTLVLYDVTSTYFEGRTCELAQFGYNRAMARPASCRSCSVCCARPKAARLRSKCSQAIPAIRRRWRAKSTSSRSVSRLSVWY